MEYWQLAAVFEIEGSNVRNLENEFARHIESFPHIAATYGADVQKFVVLYTTAFDRGNFNNPHANRDEEIAERTRWGGQVVRVVDGRQIASAIRAAFGDSPKGRA